MGSHAERGSQGDCLEHLNIRFLDLFRISIFDIRIYLPLIRIIEMVKYHTEVGYQSRKLLL
jgi:hypothetical protein